MHWQEWIGSHRDLHTMQVSDAARECGVHGKECRLIFYLCSLSDMDKFGLKVGMNG